jgi:catechol 2,3-dioxygenase-like lactoylglutathione lyase family enzyme
MSSGCCQDCRVLSIGMVVLGVTDMRRAMDFWCQALGYQLREGGAAERWTVLAPAGGTGTELALQRSQTPVREHPGMHLDLVVAGPAEQAAQVRRLVSLGAGRVGWDMYPGDPDFVVLADPDGNRFCIVDTSHGHS